MGFTPEQIKGRIKSVAKQNNADARTLMRIYMMERFLERLAQSEYRDNFIIKGGILVTAMIGVAHRSTMDIDTSMKNLNLSAEDALRVVNQVKDIDLDDGVSFEVNGVNRPQMREASLITDKFGLKKDSYILFLGRLVPEKGIRYLIEAFKNVKTDKKLVIAGGSSDTDSFMEELKDLAKGDDRILFTGFVQGAMLDELYSNAYIYTLPSDLEGMPLTSVLIPFSSEKRPK